MAPPVATETTTNTASGGSIPLLAPNPKSDYPFEHLLPVFDKSEFYAPLAPFEHTDPAARAAALPESDQRTFLKNATRVRNLTPKLGTEVVGIDLTSLDGPARDQLALEVARRGVVAFRDQPKFLAQTAEQFREWGSYFGRYDSPICLWEFCSHQFQAAYSSDIWTPRRHSRTASGLS
jgi:sulfonate dioxygenase